MGYPCGQLKEVHYVFGFVSVPSGWDTLVDYWEREGWTPFCLRPIRMGYPCGQNRPYREVQYGLRPIRMGYPCGPLTIFVLVMSTFFLYNLFDVPLTMASKSICKAEVRLLHINRINNPLSMLNFFKFTCL